MAASRILKLQHHRIAQCQSVQINILGEEEVPIQVDGEAWMQPPGTIRIIHKNRVQMLCRNKNLEISLKSWQQKQRQSISLHRDRTLSTSSEHQTICDEVFSGKELKQLLYFIESVYAFLKCVKCIIIAQPLINTNVYNKAKEIEEALEQVHPGGNLIESSLLRLQLSNIVKYTQDLCDNCTQLIKDKYFKDELQIKLNACTSNIELELKKAVIHSSADGYKRVYFNSVIDNDNKNGKGIWNRFRSGSIGVPHRSVSNWSAQDVVSWLEAINLSEYTENFLKNDIRGKELLTLNRRDLKDLDVTKLGHVKRLLQAIKNLESF